MPLIETIAPAIAGQAIGIGSDAISAGRSKKNAKELMKED